MPLDPAQVWGPDDDDPMEFWGFRKPEQPLAVRPDLDLDYLDHREATNQRGKIV
jgi:hypothetical protein